MCPIVNPLVQGGAPAGGGGAPPPAESASDYTPPAHTTSGSLSLGSMGLGHEDNIATHVGAAVTIALAVIVLFKVAGFRFAVDAGVAGGGK